MVDSFQKEMYEPFNFFLSAFLSAARSIIQYTYERAEILGRKPDYNMLVSERPILRYFKGKRDINIHVQPVKSIQQVNIDLYSSVTVQTKESVRIQMIEADGSISRDETYETPASVQSRQEKDNDEPGPVRSLHYRFDDWPGEEDVLELSKEYLVNLRTFVNNAHSTGLI
ncbi:hypothetical protein BBD40_25785 [Paenibacillus ihbetae]|uniref:Uncharacterized protein n=2 Tax=Paenibacillus ihbetae TaxID=1870820 RepID=A0ABX3JTJ3_9BACL|nr:hypothetical protein BBD40_25785 [Paenibacillus ihbetae]